MISTKIISQFIINKMDEMKVIVTFSGGKDSLASLLWDNFTNTEIPDPDKYWRANKIKNNLL